MCHQACPPFPRTRQRGSRRQPCRSSANDGRQSPPARPPGFCGLARWLCLGWAVRHASCPACGMAARMGRPRADRPRSSFSRRGPLSRRPCPHQERRWLGAVHPAPTWQRALQHQASQLRTLLAWAATCKVLTSGHRRSSPRRRHCPRCQEPSLRCGHRPSPECLSLSRMLCSRRSRRQVRCTARDGMMLLPPRRASREQRRAAAHGGSRKHGISLWRFPPAMTNGWRPSRRSILGRCRTVGRRATSVRMRPTPTASGCSAWGPSRPD